LVGVVVPAGEHAVDLVGPLLTGQVGDLLAAGELRGVPAAVLAAASLSLFPLLPALGLGLLLVGHPLLRARHVLLGARLLAAVGVGQLVPLLLRVPLRSGDALVTVGVAELSTPGRRGGLVTGTAQPGLRGLQLAA